MYCYISLEVFMPYWNLEQTKAGRWAVVWIWIRSNPSWVKSTSDFLFYFTAACAVFAHMLQMSSDSCSISDVTPAVHEWHGTLMVLTTNL